LGATVGDFLDKPLDQGGLAMTDAGRWLAEQRAVWEARLDRLEAYVKTIEKKSRKRRLK
jgi:uncharacterized membrane-anchored protein